MKLLVVGATGTLGRQIVRHALDNGYSVRCLVRNLRKASFLKEWGAELIVGDLTKPETLSPALKDIEAVIDAATARPSEGIRQVDWEGQVNLIQASKRAKIKRFIFFSILNADKYPEIPLMAIKQATEQFLAESGLNYTILRPCGFMQGLIGQYGIPILDNQPVWITGESSPIAYINTQDVAKFALKAIETPATENRTFPVVGLRPWTAEEIIQLSERLSDREAKISRIPLPLLIALRRFLRFFQWTYNVADRLAFAEVLATGQPLDAPMTEVYETFGLDPAQTSPLESYLQEYFSQIIKKLKALDYEQKKSKKRKRSPFKSKNPI
jgi:uncharacterized protein YbjT (DUF2867 family)